MCSSDLQIASQHPPEQRMREPILSRAALDPKQDPVVRGALEAVGCLRVVQDLPQDARVDCVPDERRDGERRATAIAEAVQPTRDDLADALRNAPPIQLRSEVSSAGEEANDLAQKEWVATGFAIQRFAKPSIFCGNKQPRTTLRDKALILCCGLFLWDKSRRLQRQSCHPRGRQVPNLRQVPLLLVALLCLRQGHPLKRVLPERRPSPCPSQGQLAHASL